MIRRHLTYANVTATLALVLAAGTGAVYAAGEIGSRELENNSVRTQDLKDRRGVIGEDVKKNTLGEKEIDESSLVGDRIVSLEGTQALDCDPAVPCSRIVSPKLSNSTRPADYCVTTTGGVSSEADGANAECEIAPSMVRTQRSLKLHSARTRTTLRLTRQMVLHGPW